MVFCLKLPDSLKSSLLQCRPSCSLISSDDSKDTLARIRQLDPNIGKLFHLKRKDTSQAPLRLLSELPLHSKSDLENCIPGKLDGFIAVSYCWRNNQWRPVKGFEEKSSIYFPGLPVADGIFKEILKLKTRSEGIWIDGLCINQNNRREKVYAIASMDLIYKSARLVVIALEDIEISQEEAAIITQLQSPDSSYLPCQSGSDFLDSIVKSYPLTLWNLLAKIGSARWFDRAWCSHEFHLCQDAAFVIPCVGGKTITLLLKTLHCMLKSRVFFISRLTDVSKASVQAYSRLDLLLSSHFINTKGVLKASPVMGICFMILNLETSRLCDKISIVLNLIGLSLYFDGEIESDLQCRYISGILAMAAGDAMALCCTGPKLKRGRINRTRNMCAFPYFCSPQLSDLVHLSDRYPPKFQGWGESVIVQPGKLTIDALFGSGAIQRPSIESLDKARIFLEACWKSHCYIFEQIEPAQWASPNFDRKRAFLHHGTTYLACSLDLGFDWMGTSLEEIGYPTLPQGLKGYSMELLQPLGDIAMKYLLICHNKVELLLRYLFFAFHHVLLLGNTACNTAIILLGKNQRAMITIPKVYNSCTASRTFFIVPAIFAEPTYTFTKRFWCVQRHHRGDQIFYTVLDKTYLWGCGAVTQDRKFVQMKIAIDIAG